MKVRIGVSNRHVHLKKDDFIKLFGEVELIKDKDWVHIFDGRVCGIFVKKGQEKASYLEPEYGLDYYKRTIFCGKTFGKKLGVKLGVNVRGKF